MAAPLIEFSLLFEIGLIVVSATLLSFLAKHLKQPALIAYILAGIIIGPIGLGSMGLEFAGIPLGITDLEDALILSTLGVAFLLFGVGVESDFSKLADLGKVVVVGGTLQVLLTILVVFVGTFMFNLFDFTQSIYLGLILAFSSTLVVVKILSDSHQITTLHGRLLVGFLLVQDAFVIIALPFLANLEQLFSFNVFAPVLAVGAFLLVFAYLLNRHVYPAVFSYSVRSDELLFLASVTSLFVFILIAFALNFSIPLAAFIAGLALSNLPYNLEVFHRIKALRDFFATIFFVTLGMQINLGFAYFPLTLLLFVLFVVFVFKPVLFYLITLFSGYGGRISVFVALALAQVSEFSFIIADLGRDILNRTPGLHSLVIIVIALSMALTPYLMHHSEPIYERLNRSSARFTKNLKENRRFYQKVNQLENVPKNMKEHVVIVGAGVVGFNIAKALFREYPLVVIDHNYDVILNSIKNGINSIYGSADNREILRKANLQQAKLLIISMPDTKAAVSVVKYAKSVNPGIVVFGSAHYFHEASELYNAGIDYVIMYHVIGSNVFLKNIAYYLQSGNTIDINNLTEEYKKYLKEKVSEEKQHFNI